MYQTLMLEKNDHIATVIFNRPEKMNAINLQMHDDILNALDEIESDKNIFVLILAANGKAFCSGHDLSALRSGSEEFRKHKIIRKLVDFKIPVLAAIQGYALAEGMQIALAADIIVATENARFATTGVIHGSICNYAVFALAQVIGRNRAAEMLFTGRRVDGQEALAWGLVNRLVSADQLLDSIKEIARVIGGLAPLSVRYTREILRMHEYDTQAVDHVSAIVDLLARTRDQKEGFSAILEKRKPDFKGM